MKNQDVIQQLKDQGLTVEVTHKRLPRAIHEEETTSETPKKASGPNPRGGETRVEIMNEEGVLLANGSARCSEKDNYNRYIGLAIALGRARKTLS